MIYKNKVLSRRSFVAGSTALLAMVALGQGGTPGRDAQFTARQFHNQPEGTPLHKNLLGMWASVKAETDGRFVVQTFAQNNNLPGSDPEALKMLVSGELEFFTVWNAYFTELVPVVEIMALPYVFTSRKQVLSVLDGEFGDYLRTEMAAKGVYDFPRGCFENGFRQISTNSRPIRTAEDLVGLKIRTPDSDLFLDFFKTLGAEPVSTNFAQLYEALKNGTVDGQDNPVQVTEANKFYEVQKYLSITNHMWSGFNQLANLKFWNGLPGNIQEIIKRYVVRFVARQRDEQDQLNRELLEVLPRHGMSIQKADTATLRSRLGPFYNRWKAHFGASAWRRLEAQVGKIRP